MQYKIMWLILFTLAACEEKSTQPGDRYDYMYFERYGGGNLEFNVYPTTVSDIFSANVSKLNFKDTLINLSLIRDTANGEILDALTDALKGKYKITGDFKRDTLDIVGTWAFIYMIRDHDSTEVTNTALCNILLGLESIIRENLE